MIAVGARAGDARDRAAGPRLGVVYVVVALAILFVAGPRGHLAALITRGRLDRASGPGGRAGAGVHVLKPYQVQRLTAFLHPPHNPAQQGYQQIQSKIAIGSGQKTGRGAGHADEARIRRPRGPDRLHLRRGRRASRLRRRCPRLSLYALLIWRTLRILTIAKNLFGALIAGGIVAMFMFQVFVNVGMTVGIMPITGVTLPLLSYGGSSVLTTFLALGLLQSIYVQARTSAALKGRVLRF